MCSSAMDVSPPPLTMQFLAYDDDDKKDVECNNEAFSTDRMTTDQVLVGLTASFTRRVSFHNEDEVSDRRQYKQQYRPVDCRFDPWSNAPVKTPPDHAAAAAAATPASTTMIAMVGALTTTKSSPAVWKEQGHAFVLGDDDGGGGGDVGVGGLFAGGGYTNKNNGISTSPSNHTMATLPFSTSIGGGSSSGFTNTEIPMMMTATRMMVCDFSLPPMAPSLQCGAINGYSTSVVGFVEPLVNGGTPLSSLPPPSPSPPRPRPQPVVSSSDIPAFIVFATKNYKYSHQIGRIDADGCGRENKTSCGDGVSNVSSFRYDNTVVIQEDDVSLLADNPDDDDHDILPRSTCDVLAHTGIFDEMVDLDDSDDEVEVDGVEGNRS